MHIRKVLSQNFKLKIFYKFLNFIPRHLVCFTSTTTSLILARYFKDLFHHKYTLLNKTTEVDQGESITSEYKTLDYHYYSSIFSTYVRQHTYNLTKKRPIYKNTKVIHSYFFNYKQNILQIFKRLKFLDQWSIYI